jgi:hypothetical protein
MAPAAFLEEKIRPLVSPAIPSLNRTLKEKKATSGLVSQVRLASNSILNDIRFKRNVEHAIALTPGNHIEEWNWLKITKRFEFE